MLAFLYLILCLVFGISLISLCIPDVRRLFVACSPSKKIVSKIPSVMFTIPAGFTIGMLCITAFNYYLTLGLSYAIHGSELCKKLSVLITFAVFAIVIASNISVCLKRDPKDPTNSAIPEYKNTVGNILYYGISTIVFTIVSAFLMFYTYRTSGNELYAGFSTFSDLSPHTAMVSSFGVGFNFPTQYMHYSGDGIQYHFFFYYLCGLLEYLGLPIDWAINLPSMIVMVSAFELTGLITVLYFRRRSGFIIAPILVLFRSSMNVFEHIKELKGLGIPAKAIFESILHGTEWYGVTPYDNWGIWAINVYPNQRHLMLGVSCILILMLLMTPFVRRMGISLIKAADANERFKAFINSREAWLWRKEDPLHPLGLLALSSIITALMPFFHGSALIGVLLVLLIMAIVSESRLIYAAIAAASVISSYIQTKAFAGTAGNVVKFRYQPGFILEDKSFGSVAHYLYVVTGFTLIIALLFGIVLLVRDIIKKKPLYRTLILLAGLAPGVFAFLYQVSLEMLANHKFIQFSLIIADIFVAGALSELFWLPVKVKDPLASNEDNKWKVNKGVKIALQIVSIIMAVVLIVPLTATGVSEWATYINRNKNYVTVNTESELTEWIIENTSPEDVFLTPQWSLNRFFLAGRPAYYAWPYYAWSAGHDTYTREKIYYWLISGCGGDIDEFRRYCQERGIRYLIDDPEFNSYNYPEGISYNSEFFAQNLQQVAYFSGEGTIVYKIY